MWRRVRSRSASRTGTSTEVILRLLNTELKVINSSTLHLLNKAQLLLDIRKRLREVKLSRLLILNLDLWLSVRATNEVLWNHRTNKLIRNATDGGTNWDRKETKGEGVTPAAAVETWVGGDGEGLASDKDDQDLQANHDDVDANEEVVLGDALEDVELVVQTTVACKG